MKKVNLILAIIMSFLFIGIVNAEEVPVGSKDLDYSTCVAFANTFKSLEGTYYYKYCYRVGCSNGKYFTTNMVSGAGYRCINGNYDPYKNVSSNGCSSYDGACSTNNGTYCTKVVMIDCNRKSNGDAYEKATSQAKTEKTTTTTAATTKTNKTTKKTTKKKKTVETTTTKYITTTTTMTTTTTKAKSNNTNILNIFVDGQKLNYDANVSEYDIQAEASTTSIEIEVELEDSNAVYYVSGNNELVPEEEGIITITVEAEDGTTKDVTINVKRYNKDNNACSLANIYIEGYDINFAKNTYEYSLTLPQKTKSIEIETVPVDEEAYIEVIGNEKLKNKSVIKVQVIGTDDSLCVYSINIKKKNNTWKIFLLIIVLIAILGVGLFFLMKNLKKSKNQYKYE